MTAADVDAYLAQVPEPARAVLTDLRTRLHVLLPDAQEHITYGVPTLKVGGRGVAGFGLQRSHVSYFPMSGSITGELAEELADYVTSKGAVRLPPGGTLPTDLLEALVAARLAEIERIGR